MRASRVERAYAILMKTLLQMPFKKNKRSKEKMFSASLRIIKDTKYVSIAFGMNEQLAFSDVYHE